MECEHKWNGCVCAECGEMRNEGHVIGGGDVPCACKTCNRIFHDFVLIEERWVCSKCGVPMVED